MICYNKCVMEGKVRDLVTLFESCAIQHFTEPPPRYLRVANPFTFKILKFWHRYIFLSSKVTPNEYEPCFQNKNTVPCSCDTQWISKPFASYNSSQHCKSEKTKYTMS